MFYANHNKCSLTLSLIMNSFEQKNLSHLELINTFVLVNSDYLLERERERERDAGVYIYARVRITY